MHLKKLINEFVLDTYNDDGYVMSFDRVNGTASLKVNYHSLANGKITIEVEMWNLMGYLYKKIELGNK